MTSTRKYKISKNQNVGSPDAETDENLLDVFVRIPNVDHLIDTKNQESILIGRTGSGKSAILKYLKEKCENIHVIEPEAMSLRFLSNSTILKYFKSLDVNLTLFYKVLWKHVFVVELLKLHFNEDLNEKEGTKFKRIIKSIWDKMTKSNPRKERALKYLENWSDDFWKETEYRIRSIEQSLITNFAGKVGANVDDILNFELGGDLTNSENKIYEAKHKAESVIHDT